MMTRTSLKRILCAHTFICVAVTSILLIIVLKIIINGLIEQRLLDDNQSYAQKTADTLDSTIQTAKKEISYAAGAILTFSDPEKMQREADRLRLQSDMFNSVIIISPRGRVIMSSPEGFLPPDLSLHVAAEQLEKVKKGVYISSPFTPVTGNYLMFLSSPIYNIKGDYLGYIAGSVYLQKTSFLNRVLSRHFYGSTTDISVITEAGEVIYSESGLLQKREAPQPVMGNSNEKSGAYKTNLSGNPCLMGFATLSETGWQVQICSSQSVTDTIYSQVESSALPWVAIIILLMLILGILVSYRIAAPLENLSALTVAMAESDLKGRLIRVRTWYEEAESIKIALIKFSDILLSRMQYLKNIALRDPLTGLYNRRGFDEAIAPLMVSSKEHGLIVIDIDHFKSINDEFGHDAGDETLKSVAKVIQLSCRSSDIPCRFGGEEFVIFLGNSGLDDAIKAAERIRTTVMDTPYAQIGRVTLSAGVTHLALHQNDLGASMQAADSALYEAKRSGRNSVYVYQKESNA